jgi:ubiquinone biosynthesis protein
MNVQEHIEGIRGNDLAAIDSAGLDRKALAARGVDAVLKMILVDGFFHADPHPGNVMYLPGNRIALIDFGMVGRLSPARRRQIIDLLAGLAGHDEEAMLEVLLDWRGDDFVDEARLAADLGEFAFDYADMQLKDLKIGVLLHRVSAILREHSIVLPTDLTLLFKALITLEGLGHLSFPKILSSADSRDEAESAHHPARCLPPSICLGRLSPTYSSRNAGLKSRISFSAISSILL